MYYNKYLYPIDIDILKLRLEGLVRFRLLAQRLFFLTHLLFAALKLSSVR